jgi:hypothetical protein
MDTVWIGIVLLACLVSSYVTLVFVKKEEKSRYPEDDLRNFPLLRENIFSIIDFLHTQDIESFIKHTPDPGKGKLAIRFIEDRLRDISFRGFRFSGAESEIIRDKSRLEYELKTCKAVEKVLKETKDDPSSYRMSDNPIVVVLSIWNDMDQVLDSIISDFGKGF